jgi:MFS family permease
MSLELQLLVLALEAALYPTLLAVVVLLLAQPRPRRLLAVYLTGALTVSIVVGCLIVYALAHSGTLDNSHATVSWTADLVLGALALLLALALWRRADVRLAERRRARRPDPGAEATEPWSQRVLAGGSAPLVFLAAVALNLPGAAYLIGLKDISAAHTSTARAFVLIVAFNAIMFLLAEVPLGGLTFAPDQTGARVERLNAWLSRNGRTIAIVLCGAFGAFLVARGLITASR